MRALLLLLAAAAAMLMLGCGTANVGNSEPMGAMEELDISRDTSALFRRFFNDTVNHQSGGRWSVASNAAGKRWTLSNTSYSGPKSWLLGGNYWNNEQDTLTSNPFTIADNTGGVNLSFFARWSIAEGDSASVQVRKGSLEWTTLATYTAGQNSAYPGWTKYYYALGENFSGVGEVWQIRFVFTSDAAVTDWGIAIDSVSVYQTQLAKPLGVQASDYEFGNGVFVSWQDSTDSVEPDYYTLHRYDSDVWPYFAHLGQVDPYDGGLFGGYFDTTAPKGISCFYWLIAHKAGWPDSPSSTLTTGVW